MDKSVEEGFLDEEKKSEKFGALKGVIGSDRWCKWVGMERPRLDTWIPDTAVDDRIQATFGVFNSDGYAQRAGTHLNQAEFTRAIVSATDKVDVMIASGDCTAEKIKAALTVIEAAALTLTFGGDLDSFLPKIESYAALSDDAKVELINDESDTSEKFCRAHGRMDSMNDDITGARRAQQQEELERLPPWVQAYLDDLEDNEVAKIVITGLLKNEEHKEQLIDPIFVLEQSDIDQGVHSFLVPLLATRPEAGDVVEGDAPAEVAEVAETDEEE